MWRACGLSYLPRIEHGSGWFWAAAISLRLWRWARLLWADTQKGTRMTHNGDDMAIALTHDGITKIAPDRPFQPRYVAYAKMHGKTPEDMLILDQKRGGIGAWFSPWIRNRWAEFDRLTNRRYRIGGGHTEDGHAAFDRWLDSACQEAPQ